MDAYIAPAWLAVHLRSCAGTHSLWAPAPDGSTRAYCDVLGRDIDPAIEAPSGGDDGLCRCPVCGMAEWDGHDGAVHTHPRHRMGGACFHPRCHPAILGAAM